MSKRMVDLEVEDGKVASINGLEVSGGTAVVANPQEEATQQLEKIKIDNIAYNIAGGGALEKRIEAGPITLEAKQYSVGEFVNGETTSKEVESFIGILLFKDGSSNEGLPSVTIGDAVFIPYQYLYDYKTRYLRYGLLCIKAGTVATRTYKTVYIRYVGKA